MAVVGEDPRQRVAVGGVAPAGGDQRAGRVGGDELDQDPLGGDAPPAPEPSPAASTDASAPRYQSSERNRFRKPGPATSVRSSVAPSTPLSASPSRSGDLARRGAEHRREQHRRVRRVVALAGALRALEPRLGGDRARRPRTRRAPTATARAPPRAGRPGAPSQTSALTALDRARRLEQPLRGARALGRPERDQPVAGVDHRLRRRLRLETARPTRRSATITDLAAHVVDRLADALARRAGTSISSIR